MLCPIGMLKLHLDTSDFVRCSRSMPPENTLFNISCPVVYEDLEKYSRLVYALCELDPL